MRASTLRRCLCALMLALPMGCAAHLARPARRHRAAPRVATRIPSPPSGAIELVRSLTNTVGPRLTGSAGDPLAVAWAERTMRELGFVNVHAEPVRAVHWERGEEHGEIVAPVRHTLHLAALGGSPGTPAEGITARVVEFSDLDSLRRASEQDVQGRIVFLSQVMRRTQNGAGYGEAVGIRGAGPMEAARKGAVALVIRSVGTDVSRMPHTGATRAPPDGRTVPSAALSVADADTLHDLVGRGVPVELRLSLGARTLAPTDTANVIGEVRGTTHPDEVILLGAHLDSWDLGRGALDDGAGVSIVLSCARGFVARPLARTVRVVLFANEENGLAGARAYAEAHRAEVARHVVAMEADSGDGEVYAARWGGASEQRSRVQRMLEGVVPPGVRFDPEDGHGGADVSPLRALGVPIIDLEQDMSTYFDHHHTANDTASVVRPEALDQVVDVMQRAVRAVASEEADLGRAPVTPEAHR